jgi:sugar phosphate permease
VTVEVKEPVKVGTPEFDELMNFLDRRAKEGEEGDKTRKSTLKAVILPNKEIWVLPY